MSMLHYAYAVRAVSSRIFTRLQVSTFEQFLVVCLGGNRAPRMQFYDPDEAYENLVEILNGFEIEVIEKMEDQLTKYAFPFFLASYLSIVS
jgi:hypothetical protein